MLKKVASTKLLSGLFVAGGILGMNQAAKAGNVVNSEVQSCLLPNSIP